MCLQSAQTAGISPAALRQAIMIHHARHQTEWELAHDWDPWADWVYCLRISGLPPEEIARARQAYFSFFCNRADADQVSPIQVSEIRINTDIQACEINEELKN
jgi:hypothetical protein